MTTLQDLNLRLLNIETEQIRHYQRTAGVTSALTAFATMLVIGFVMGSSFRSNHGLVGALVLGVLGMTALTLISKCHQHVAYHERRAGLHSRSLALPEELNEIESSHVGPDLIPGSSFGVVLLIAPWCTLFTSAMLLIMLTADAAQ